MQVFTIHVQGELFKADGEVVSSGRPAGATDKYELAAYPKAILRPPAVVLSSSSSDEAEALKQRLAEAAQQERTICRQVHRLAMSNSSMVLSPMRPGVNPVNPECVLRR